MASGQDYSETGAQSTDPKTLSRFILQGMQEHKDAKGDLTILLQSVALACKTISNACNKAGIFNLYGLDGSSNSSGDDQKKLDIYSNDVMINCMKFSGKVGILASEENDEPIMMSPKGKYVAVFDPLDGSSNIDANVSVGTIFAIYERVTSEEEGPCNETDLLQKGEKMVCAGYCMYGGATILVLSFGKDSGVQGFTLDPSLGEFLLTHRNLRIPENGKIYSVNEGNMVKWDSTILGYVQSLKRDGKYKARYIGSMVADVHRTLLYGGIFMYPADKKNPNGKLRLVYELNPMAFIVENAGGMATTGRERILDLQPDSVHCRRPVVLGSRVMVDAVRQMYGSKGQESEAGSTPSPAKRQKLAAEAES